ncbi:MAG: hypothetical protein AAF138_07440 [Planctomycetota bacterium]
MSVANRLIVNSLATLGRMAATVMLGLLATRYAVQGLGDVDFGLLSVLGATGALLIVVVDALTASTIRHLSIEPDPNNTPRMRALFQAALTLIAASAGVVALAGVALAPFIDHVLNIPPERVDAASWTLLLSLGSLAAGIVSTPYRAVYFTRQHIVLWTLFEVMQSVLRLGVAASIFIAPMDKLVWYAGGLFAVQILTTVLAAAVALVRYPETRAWPGRTAPGVLREICSFAGWTTLSSIVWRVRMQGSQIALNLAFGPTVNTAYGIATQLSGYQNNLSAALLRPAQPAVMNATGRRDEAAIFGLVRSTNKLLSMIALFVLVPLLVDTAGFLTLWLGVYPPEAIWLTKLVLSWSAAIWIAQSHGMVVLSLDGYQRYSVTYSLIDLSGLLLGLAFVFLLKMPPWSMPLAALFTVFAGSVYRVWYLKGRWGLTIGCWVRDTLVPIATVGMIGASGAVAAYGLAEEVFWRPVAVLAGFSAPGFAAIWLIGLNTEERRLMTRFARTALDRARSFTRPAPAVAPGAGMTTVPEPSQPRGGGDQ